MIQTVVFKDWPLAKAFYIHPSISMHNGSFKKRSKTETFSGLQLDQSRNVGFASMKHTCQKQLRPCYQISSICSKADRAKGFQKDKKINTEKKYFIP